MSNYCPLPFIHLNLKQEGKVSACWRYPDRLGDYRTQTLDEIWNGENLKQLRENLIAGNQPSGCRSCWDMENNGIRSTRQQALEDYKDYVPNDTIQSIEIRFDNICNLMCRHCSPEYSSKWESAVKKNKFLLDKMKEYKTYRKSSTHISLTDETIEEVVSLAPNLKEILIAGGEPLYHEKHYGFIEKILPYSRNITLSYNTNLTTLEHKGKNILDLWKHFKRVIIRASIDGDPHCYDYIRVGGDLGSIETNLKKVKTLNNVIVSATCTTNMLNITRLISIIKYFKSLDVRFHSSVVQYPRALNPKCLPLPLKHKVTAEWQEYLAQLTESDADKRIKKYGQTVVDYMNSEEYDFAEFKDYALTLDQYHKTSLSSIYPEFDPYL